MIYIRISDNEAVVFKLESITFNKRNWIQFLLVKNSISFLMTFSNSLNSSLRIDLKWFKLGHFDIKLLGLISIFIGFDLPSSKTYIDIKEIGNAILLWFMSIEYFNSKDDSKASTYLSELKFFSSLAAII